MIKLLQMPIGNIFVAADEPDNVCGGNKAVTANGLNDKETSVSDTLSGKSLWSAPEFRKTFLQSHHSLPNMSPQGRCFGGLSSEALCLLVAATVAFNAISSLAMLSSTEAAEAALAAVNICCLYQRRFSGGG